jgi:hypothetical protein
MALSNPFKRWLPRLMRGTFLTAGIFFGNLQSSKAQVDVPGLSPHVKTEAFDAQTKLQLAANSDTIIYSGRDSTRLAFLYANCALTAQTIDEVPDTALTLWENMQTLKNSTTIMGPALADFSARARIFYGYAKMSNTVGLWSSYNGLVEIANDAGYSQNFRLLCQTHETIHGIQSANKIDKEDMSWSIWDFQRACMADEAAAQVGEYLLALDFYHDSIPDLLNEKQDISTKVKTRLLKEFNAAQADSLPYAQDLAAVGESEFYTQFKDQGWLNFYNNWTLKHYITWLNYGWLKAPSEKTYGLETARKSGYISADFNFTAGIDSLPANLFGTNTRMKQAFDYAECTRLYRTRGEKDSLYLATLARLKKENNPYLGVDMKEVGKKLADPANKLDALGVMDYFAAELKKNLPAPVGNKSKTRRP